VVSSLEEVSSEVLKRVTPSENERKKILKLTQELIQRLKQEAKKRGIETEIRLEGSVAKNTWLRDTPEIDIFIRVPTTMPREEFRNVCLKIAKEATQNSKQIERYAEHPYLEAIIGDVYVNIVPCYSVKQGKWLSSTDRTPFHTNYIKSMLDEKKAKEVRILKRFMKGVNIYGAETKVGGFSGYSCELLVLKYGSFVKVLRAASNWRERTVIDHEKQYKTKTEVEKAFEQNLILVDPVDKTRNVAAAVRKDKLDEFVVASRAFLRTPDLKFFYPEEVEALDEIELCNTMSLRGSASVFITFKGIFKIPDVLWGQLFKSQKAIRKMIVNYGFSVLRDKVWSNERDFNIFIFELENRFLSNIKRHLGPPLRKKKECESFLRKHGNSNSTVSGPRVEEGRWVIDVKRDYIDVVKLLTERLKGGGRSNGLAELVSKALTESMKVLVNDEIMKLYTEYPDFAKYLTQYLKGKPRWL
jgi:tRNA nucleotidyltransferase (CCA-adding enzyme)